MTQWEQACLRKRQSARVVQLSMHLAVIVHRAMIRGVQRPGGGFYRH